MFIKIKNFSSYYNNFVRLYIHFIKIKNNLWPISKKERLKFFLITLLMFCILGIQNLVRALKDSIVNVMIGAESISFLKFWGVMPAAFLVTLIYIKLINVLKSETIFYIIITIFLTFFAVFAFYIFPNHQVLHLDNNCVIGLIGKYPHFKWFILLFAKWSFSLFYIMAELWPNAIFSLLFWQFVNNITTIEESIRFYPLFGLFGQTGLYVSGKLLTKLSSINSFISEKFNLKLSDDYLSIQVVLSISLALGIIALYIFWVLNYKIIKKSNKENFKLQVSKKQLSLTESIKMIFSSKYIMLISTLLVFYGITINLVEGPWKAFTSKSFSTTTEFASFIGNYLSYTGIFTIIFTLLGSSIVRNLGWYSTAIITPVMIFITGILFFLISNFDPINNLALLLFAIKDPSLIAINIGAIQNVLSKSSKYTLFDSTKEMAYVPLNNELKTKGKAAADMIGIKLGKSSSALIQSIVFIIFPNSTYKSISIYLMILFSITCLAWILVVKELNKEYNDAILSS